ncbi:hypothetical protein ACFZDP_16465 [Streptomyces mirabilis]|uniref:hypothetical protein n=1 Tax=Streptomyces mirabilis TaxID=68239 RepID=UPI0036E03AE6
MQVHLSMLDAVDPRKPSVIPLVLTVTPSQHPAVQDDFGNLAHTVRPGTGAGSA